MTWHDLGDGTRRLAVSRPRGRLPAGHDPGDRARRSARRGCARLRARRQEHLHDERRVLHRRRRAAGDADDPPAGPRPRRLRRDPRPDRRRRRRHGRTLALVKEFCQGKVAEVRCAVLYEKPRSSVQCEYVWRRTDRWIDFPWSDRPPVGGAEGRSEARRCWKASSRVAGRFPIVALPRVFTSHGSRGEEHLDQEEECARRAAADDLAAAAALVVTAAGSAKQSDVVQGGLDLRRPAQRRRLVAGARRRPAGRPEGARLEGADDLQGERRPRGRRSRR